MKNDVYIYIYIYIIYLYVTQDRKTSHNGPFFLIKDRAIFGWDTTIWISGIWGCKNNINIEKITFEVVQIKFLAMHITNQTYMFEIYGRKCTKYLNGTWSLLNILMLFGIKKIDHFDP